MALAAVLCTLAVTLTGMPEAAAHHKNEQKVEKILYIPHDNRPISDKQTAEVISKLGYEVVVPPDNMLGSRTDLGHPDELWDWLKQNAQDADAAVISSDSMLYGSLVGSRKHEYSKKEVLERADRFQSFRKEHPKMELYVFGSIMRTPRSGEASGHEEPGYYRNYGADIFRYTVLKDKEEMEGLTRREKKEYDFLQRLIPKASLSDWMGRREKNFAANEKMIQLTRGNTFNYFVLGRDDNAPYSQTHLESRHLAAEGKDLGKTRFQAMAGIDERIMHLPEGYDTVIAEDGGNISQGQKQLLCIARVMLCLPPMLILDEATSSIDTRTEVRIQKAFARMMQGRTSFIVAHRLSTIREADVILVMKDGHIVEQGSHDELLAANGFYAKLYNSQFEGVET